LREREIEIERDVFVCVGGACLSRRLSSPNKIPFIFILQFEQFLEMEKFHTTGICRYVQT